jgi:hypothetical protein
LEDFSKAGSLATSPPLISDKLQEYVQEHDFTLTKLTSNLCNSARSIFFCQTY